MSLEETLRKMEDRLIRLENTSLEGEHIPDLPDQSKEALKIAKENSDRIKKLEEAETQRNLNKKVQF